MALILNTIQAEGNDEVIVAGSFAPAATGVPTAVFGSYAYTVAWTSTGKFTITFTERYAEFLSGVAMIGMNAIADLIPQWGAFTPASGAVKATLVLNILAAAVATDIAANANNRVHFTCIFRKTSFQT